MSKNIIIHPAIAPYRIDFFNSLYCALDATVYCEHKDTLEQKFDRKLINDQLLFTPIYLRPGLLGMKNLRLEILYILYREKPDVVLCSEYNIIGFLILLYKLLFNWRLSIYSICDDSYMMATNCKGVRKWMRSILLRVFCGVILSDNRALLWYEKKFAGRCRFFFFPIIQKESRFLSWLDNAKSLSEEWKKKYVLEDKKVVLYVGRLVAVKNVGGLIRAFAKVLSRCPEAYLVIVGEGEEKNALHKLVLDLQIVDKVLFVGKKEGEDLYAWYNIGELFVLPSIYEPFGTVTNEALLAGCYVLCSQEAGSSCLIKSGVNGSVFDPYDLNELVKKMNYYIDKCIPTKKVNKMQFGYDGRMIDLISFIKKGRK